MEDKLYKDIKRKYDACFDEAAKLNSMEERNKNENYLLGYFTGRFDSYNDVIEMDATERKLSRKRFTASNISNAEINKSLEDIQDRIDILCEDIRCEIDDLLDEQDDSSDDWDRYTVIEARISALKFLLDCLDENFLNYRIDCEEL